jgi:polyferredoxin
MACPGWSGASARLVLFDLGARRFYIFGLVLYPQDFIYLTGMLVISALSLFLFTAVAGRLWCGFTLPANVYTEIFMWLERKTEGERRPRMRRDKAAPGLPGKSWRKSAKQLAWVAVALWTGFTFVGYFTPIRALGSEFVALQGSWEIFWTSFTASPPTALRAYARAGVQVHVPLCPLSERHVRQGHAHRDLRQRSGASRAARAQKGRPQGCAQPGRLH